MTFFYQLSKNKPKYLNLQWPNFYDFKDDKNQDMPKEGELLNNWCDRVSDMGIPVSEEGRTILERLEKEEEKRNADVNDVILWTDWNGWGMSEVMENLVRGTRLSSSTYMANCHRQLKDFNRDIFRKTISPFKKRAYVEGLAVYLKDEDLNNWIHNEDGEGVHEIIEVIGLMALTSFEMLSEHDLFKPDSEIKTIGIVCLLLLEFLNDWAGDLHCAWGCEVVRMCDEAGIDLRKQVRKQVNVPESQLKDETDNYLEKKEASDFGDTEEADGNGYVGFANKEDWTPKDDIGGEEGMKSMPYTEYKMWYRWDWDLEVSANAGK